MPAPETVKVRQELERILASAVFANSPRMSRFLKFVVEETLNGRLIKEYIVAVEVFDKGEDYDPKADSTVRTEASKLRSRLGRYVLNKVDFARNKYYYSRYYGHQYKNYYAEAV